MRDDEERDGPSKTKDPRPKRGWQIWAWRRSWDLGLKSVLIYKRDATNLVDQVCNAFVDC